MMLDGFLRNDREKVIGEISEHNGRVRAHIRIMQMNAAGEWVHTKRGIAIEPTQTASLRDAVMALTDLVTPKTVAEIPAGREPVHVALSKYRGQLLIDLRHFYKDADGQFKPGPKGVSVAVDLLDDLIDLTKELAAAAKEDGYVG